jgi:transposase
MWPPWQSIDAVYLCAAPVDFRKGMGSLAVYVHDALDLDPLSSSLFVFTNRRRDAVKVLGWDRTGFALWHKKLEQARFSWPREAAQQGRVTLDVAQLQWLLRGCDLARYCPHKTLDYAGVY